MTLADINARVTFLTNATVTDYTYQNRTINLNKWYYQVQTWILQSQDEWDFDDKNLTTNFPIATTALVANVPDYNLPTSLIKVKRVEITYDGTNYHVASPLDVGTLSNPTDTTSISANFTTDNPYYDIQGESIVLYPIPTANQAAGLRVFFDRSVTPFTYTSESSNQLLTGTASPGFDAQFHDIIALGMSYEWNSAKKQDKSLLTDINLMKLDLQNHYGSKQKDRVLTLGASYVDYE